MARILLLDEDSPLKILTRSALRTGGHETVLANDAAEVIALATNERFDLILVDLAPPDMNGTAMVRQLALVTGHGGTPIVTMADAGAPVDLVAVAQAGAVDHLRKPFGFGELDTTINRFATASPDRVEDLRVIRQSSAELYKQTIELMETAKTAG